MTNLAKYFTLLIILIGCTFNQKKITKKRVGDFMVEAEFFNDSIVNGNAKFYTLDGRMFSQQNFINGLKNGAAVYFDQKGKKVDSSNYKNDLLNGFRFSYDNHGNIIYIDYFYNGMNVGPVIYKDKTVTKKFYFIDFNKNNLVNCVYDSFGNITSVNSYSNNPSFANKIYRGKKMIDFFAYLPQPPGLQIKFSIGITNAKNEDEILFEIKNKNKIFFDSILPVPKDGYYYFILSHLINYDSSINKVMIEEVSNILPPDIISK